jgi:hypothetical protein
MRRIVVTEMGVISLLERMSVSPGRASSRVRVVSGRLGDDVVGDLPLKIGGVVPRPPKTLKEASIRILSWLRRINARSIAPAGSLPAHYSHAGPTGAVAAHHPLADTKSRTHNDVEPCGAKEVDPL